MNNKTRFFFIILSTYIILQFAWWGYHLIELSQKTEATPDASMRRVGMILGEGMVFFIILIFGLWQIRKSIQKDILLSRRQSNFLLSITHELKTPIAAKKIMIQTMLKHDLNLEKRQELLKKSLEENERLELLIENILHASSLDNKAIQPVKSTFKFSELAEQIVDRIHKNYGKNFIQVNIESDAELKADRFMFEAIFSNLLENAIKYAGIESQITLYAAQEENKFVFGVKDEGPGVPLAHQTEIFSKFYRVENEETRTQKGSGLGLYIVEQFAALHKGKITYSDNKPKGANFKITLQL
jgi:K+-sensing histidine kinase KdpD